MEKTIEHGFTVPERSQNEDYPIFIIQAVGKKNKISPGAWGYVKIWQENGAWHDVFVHSGYETKEISRNMRLRMAYESAIASGANENKIFAEFDPVRVHLSDEILKSNGSNEPVYKELRDRLTALKQGQDEDDPKGSADGTNAEKLICQLLGVDYNFQTQPGYDFKVNDKYHEVKSFTGNPTIRFTSEQLCWMNRDNYFVWLVQKSGTDIDKWKIYKLCGEKVYSAIKNLARLKFQLILGPNGCESDVECESDVYLSIGVKFALNGGNVTLSDHGGCDCNNLGCNGNNGKCASAWK